MMDEQNNLILDARLREVWQRRQHLHLSAGSLALVRWLVPLFLVGMALDLIINLPAMARWIILALILGVSIFLGWIYGWRNLRSFDQARTALEIEEQEGGLDSLLVTAVQFGKDAGSGSDELKEETRRKAEGTAKKLDPRKVIDFGILHETGMMTLAIVAVLFVFGLLNISLLSTGLARIFTPWVAVVYPTSTIIEMDEEELVIKEGDRATIEIGVSGDVPESATFVLRTGEGEPREIDLEIADGKCQYLIASASRDFTYRVEAGDARSEWREVRVIKAPRISSVSVGVEYPEYLEKETETIEALTLTVPQDSRIHWKLELDQSVRDVKLLRDGKDPMPLETSDDGRALVLKEEVDASRGYSFTWTEKEHGYEFASPRYFLQVAADQFPQVELSSPDANLDAMTGRELKLGIRARDDHGIGSATITYRVNLRPEKTVAIEEAIQNGGGEQILGWDYREELPDLKVGDSVSFVVEVADKYPDGTHKARSETRRITFLSREDYLAQIAKKKDRLLSRVRSTYRQERAAHELVSKLDPADESYVQTCQLEAIRQEMLRQQLKDIAGEVQALLDDLAANKVTEAVELDTLVAVRDGLNSIAEDQIAKAASLLRGQTDAASDEEMDPTPAVLVVNEAARHLADLVLQRGIDFAREVLAREAHMLAREQVEIRLLTIRSKGDGLAERQAKLAEWTDHLISSLRGGMRYDKRPISVLGLTRRIKELRASGAEDKMKKAEELIQGGKIAEASELQNEIVQPLLKAEFSMRTGGEYAAIMKFRSQFVAIFDLQEELRLKCEGMSDEDYSKNHRELAAAQAEVQERLIMTMLPPIPSQRPSLFDYGFPDPPFLEKRRIFLEKLMYEAKTILESGERKPIGRHLELANHLGDFEEVLDRSAVELSLRAQGLNSLVSAVTERVSMIEDFEERQISLLEKTEEAALDEVKSESLAEEQKFLSEEIAAFRQELMESEKDNSDVLPLLSRLEQAVKLTGEAVTPLQENKPEDALEPQEEAADLLAEVLTLVLAQAERLSLLQGLYSFQRSVGNASGWMADIVDEQTDLVEETQKAKPEDAAKLLPVMKNLRQCYTDIAPVLDLVAGRLDAGTPLLFAGTDMEDAIIAVEDEDFLDAADAQEVATESLAEVKELVDAVQRQTGYVAEIVEFLHSSQGGASSMAFRQNQLRADPGDDALARQEALQNEGNEYGRLLVRASGMEKFAEAGEQMGRSFTMLKSGNVEGAKSLMELAEASLKTHGEELLLVISMLHGLPDIEMTSASPEELGLLLDVLALASEQRDLSRQMEEAGAGGLKEFASRQEKLEKDSTKTLKGVFAVAPKEEGEKYTQGEAPHPKLLAANQAYAKLTAAMKAGNFAKARKQQEEINDVLRHFIIEQALILETGVGAAASSDDPVLTEAETDDLSESVANFVSDFVAGEAPKDKSTEWEVLGNRDRAALNQNFARELPLEYRGTLKNYYERVAK